MSSLRIAGLVCLLVSSVASAAHVSPLTREDAWRTVLQSAVDQQKSDHRSPEFARNAAVWDWMLARLWEGSGEGSVLRDESIAAIEARRVVLRNAGRSLTKQKKRREALLADLFKAVQNRQVVPGLEARLQSLQPVFPDRTQLSVSVEVAPAGVSPEATASASIASAPPPPLAQSPSELTRLIKGEVELLSRRLRTIGEDLALIETVSAENWSVLDEFLDRHYEDAVELNRQKKEHLRRRTEASTIN